MAAGESMTNQRLKENLERMTINQSLEVYQETTNNVLHPMGSACSNSGALLDSISDIVAKVDSLTEDERIQLNAETEFIFRGR